MPPAFFDEVKRYQRQLGAVAGFVFAAPNAKNGMDRHLFDKWLSVAEAKAELPKLGRRRTQPNDPLFEAVMTTPMGPVSCSLPWLRCWSRAMSGVA
jgi:hypothetical protein